MSLQTNTEQMRHGTRILTPYFVAATILLGTAAVLVGPVAGSLHFRQAKDAIPLRKPLSAMDVDKLFPYRVTQRLTLEPTVVEALGTDQYINWVLEDTSVPAGDPLRLGLLFVTYDTGGQNLVPHVPDECRLGAGYQPSQGHENREVRLPSLRQQEVPLRVCSFVKTAVFNRDEVTVTYLFHANGAFAGTREGVRILFNDPRDRFGYSSKVEISFPQATREENVRGAAKLLDRLLPLLVGEHWPDFEAAEAGGLKAS